MCEVQLGLTLHREDVLGAGGMAPPFLVSAVDGCEQLASSPGRFIRTKDQPVAIGYEVGWVRGLVRTLQRRETNPGRPARLLAAWLSTHGPHARLLHVY
jgi:hypothetical protein